jgi:hypothetical protein
VHHLNGITRVSQATVEIRSLKDCTENFVSVHFADSSLTLLNTEGFFAQVVAVKSPTLLTANGRGADDYEEEEEEIVDVPYTYEVEEVHEQEVVKEETVERTVPQVRANYAYKGNGMEMEKGEVSGILNNTNFFVA